MEPEAPKLTTFGALIRFAASREEEAACRYERWTADAGQRSTAPFSALASAHRKRATQLNRVVQEQLNEMTLEPISGLRAEDYPAAEEPRAEAEAGERIALALDLEAQLARLYDDITRQAAPVLGRAARMLARFVRESQRTIEELRNA